MGRGWDGRSRCCCSRRRAAGGWRRRTQARLRPAPAGRAAEGAAAAPAAAATSRCARRSLRSSGRAAAPPAARPDARTSAARASRSSATTPGTGRARPRVAETRTPGSLVRAPGRPRSMSLCKPSLVSPPGRPEGGGDHSSRTAVARRLQQPTRRLGRAALRRLPTWPCSRWGLPCRPRCRGRGGLLPRLFTLAVGRVSERRRSVLCGTLLGVAATGCYPASCSVEPGLSSRRASTAGDHPSDLDAGNVHRGGDARNV
jgi:hypothetical protein